MEYKNIIVHLMWKNVRKYGQENIAPSAIETKHVVTVNGIV